MIYRVDVPKLKASLDLKIADAFRRVGSLRSAVEQRFLAFPLLRAAGGIESLLSVFRRIDGDYYAFPTGEKVFSATFAESMKLSLEASYGPEYSWGIGFSCGLGLLPRDRSKESIGTTLDCFIRTNDYRKNNLKTLGMLSPEWDTLNTGVSVEVWY
jgi:hypothetical protein